MLYDHYQFGLQVQIITTKLQEIPGNLTYDLQNVSKTLVVWQDMSSGTDLRCAVPVAVLFLAPNKSSVTQNTEIEKVHIAAPLPHFHYHSRYTVSFSLATVLLTLLSNLNACKDTLLIPCRIGSTVLKGCTLPVTTHRRPLPTPEKKKTLKQLCSLSNGFKLCCRYGGQRQTNCVKFVACAPLCFWKAISSVQLRTLVHAMLSQISVTLAVFTSWSSLFIQLPLAHIAANLSGRSYTFLTQNRGVSPKNAYTCLAT